MKPCFRFAAVMCCLSTGVMLGCSSGQSFPTGTVRGAVTLNGHPLSAGEVTLYSKALGVGASAPLDAEGKFELAEPLRGGDYQVAVLPPPPPPPQDAIPVAPPVDNTIPTKYRSFDTSELQITIKPGDNQLELSLQP